MGKQVSEVFHADEILNRGTDEILAANPPADSKFAGIDFGMVAAVKPVLGYHAAFLAKSSVKLSGSKTENKATSYMVRTELNGKESDGTLILNVGESSGGTALTGYDKHTKKCVMAWMDFLSTGIY